MSSPSPYQVEHRCPQCSAPIVLNEDDHLLSCPYCRVRLYLSFEGCPRYYLSPRDDKETPFFVPYWRSKGIEFSIRGGGIEESVVDRTWNASPFGCFPSSLGARPQTQRLRLTEPDGQPGLLPALLPPDQPPVIEPLPSLLGLDFRETEKPILFQVVLKDTFSLIYLPAFQRGGALYDGIDGKVLGSAPDGLLETGLQGNDRDRFRYHFVPALCPNCGNDLVGDKESRIVFCQSCMVGFSLSDDGQFRNVPFLMGKTGSKTASFLPFWRIRVEPEGLPLPGATGRILPGGRIERFDRDNFYFWVPAFRINPQLFLRLAHRATIAQPGAEPTTNVPGISSITPVTVALKEAVKVIKVLLALLSPRDSELPLRLADLPLKTEECLTVLIPFEHTGYELTNRQIPAAVPVNALKYGRYL